MLSDRGRSTSVSQARPTRADLLLARLVVRTPLSEAIFEEIADGPALTLHAWLGGQRYSVRATNGALPDPEAVTGLLNALAKEKAVDVRFLAIGTWVENGFEIISGPGDALEKLVADGLVLDVKGPAKP